MLVTTTSVGFIKKHSSGMWSHDYIECISTIKCCSMAHSYVHEGWGGGTSTQSFSVVRSREDVDDASLNVRVIFIPELNKISLRISVRVRVRKSCKNDLIAYVRTLH